MKKIVVKDQDAERVLNLLDEIKLLTFPDPDDTIALIFDLNKRLKMMYNCRGREGMFGKIILVIEDQEYVYGIDIINEFIAKKVAFFLLDREVDALANATCDELNERLLHEEIEDQKEMLLAEIEARRAPVDRRNSIYKSGGMQNQVSQELELLYLGYISAQSKIPPDFDVDINEDVYEKIRDGRIHYKVERYARKLLSQIDHPGAVNVSEFNVASKSNLQKAEGKLLKIKWSGSRKQLYHVFKQLERSGVLANSREEMTDIIKAFFQFPDGKMPAKSTIMTELNRSDNLPIKSKRIDLSKD